MSDSVIPSFFAHMMATRFEIRIAGVDENQGASVAQEAFQIGEKIEDSMSRFRANSYLARIRELEPGETLRLNELTFDCLTIAQRMQTLTEQAFSVSPRALSTQPVQPLWELLSASMEIRCISGRLDFDLGAIGKGFALDQMSAMLDEWEFPRHLLIAGGSTIVAGDPPDDGSQWACNLKDDVASKKISLKRASLSASGLAMQGRHILDPRTGQPCERINRVWTVAGTGAESDSLSTACMVLKEDEIRSLATRHPGWKVFFFEESDLKEFGTLGESDS